MGGRPYVDVDLRLPADVRAAGVARRTLDDAPYVPPDVLDRFRLAVSEVVTNAVTHGSPDQADRVELMVRVFPAKVRVEVVDEGPGFDWSLRRPELEADQGRGLYLVDHSTDRWGVHRDDATTVWFEIDLPPGGERPASGTGRG